MRTPARHHPSLAHGIGRGKSWSNWAGTAISHPQEKLTPAREEDLAAAVAKASSGVRVVGAGHSFSPIAATDGLMLSLDKLRGVVSHDQARARATIWAGTRLRELGPELDQLGLGLANQGDIDHQSLGGAIGTGTHGTGISLGCLSAPVTALRLVSAGGAILEASLLRESDVFQAARVSMGALGVMTQATMQCVPAYDLRETQEVVSAEQAIAQIDGLKDRHRHVELLVFPLGGTAIIKRLEPTSEPATEKKVKSGWDDDVPLWLSCQLGRPAPGLLRAMHRKLRWFVSGKARVARSHLIFPSERRVRFAEMEYQIPAARGPECLAQVTATIAKLGLSVGFPLEYRYVAGDEIWLSPFHGGPRASISVHQFHKVPYQPLFREIEPIFWRYGGRPHWGKLHSLGARQLAPLYPMWDRFHEVRRRLDPGGTFLTPELRRLFEA